MKPASLGVCGFLLPPVLFAVLGPSPKTNTAARTFLFTYTATLKNLPADARSVRVWIPLASSDANQTVKLKGIKSPVLTRITREPEYGNRMVFAEIRAPKAKEAQFAVQYEVTRREYSKGDLRQLARDNREPAPAPAALARFLAPDRLVPTDGRMKLLADEITRGRQTTVEIARAVYDYLFRNFRYDKSGTGWGRGDSVWACDAKRGNCTDFHSPFISMMRAQRIPARFHIGFPLPANQRQGEIPGYHCWAEFYLDGAGWIPVDISEAWKDQARHNYFFGALDANRVQFASGRDVTLAPRQSGPPLNYFIYPYVEVDGRVHEAVEKKFAFRDLSPLSQTRNR